MSVLAIMTRAENSTCLMVQLDCLVLLLKHLFNRGLVVRAQSPREFAHRWEGNLPALVGVVARLVEGEDAIEDVFDFQPAVFPSLLLGSSCGGLGC